MKLDVGCGDNPHGDVNLDLHRFTKANVIGDIHHLPFRSNAFREVYCFHVLAHIQKPRLALEELIRVSKEVIVIEVPHRFSGYVYTPYHKHTFNCNWFRSILSRLKSKGLIRWFDVDVKYGWLNPYGKLLIIPFVSIPQLINVKIGKR